MEVLEDLRGKTAELLKAGWKSGLITEEELTWRSGHLQKASTVEQMDALVADLMDSPSAGHATAMTLMSTRKLSGEALAQRTSAVTVMGSTLLDYQGFQLKGNLFIELTVIMGEVTILLPKGIKVRSEVVPVMGESHVDPQLLTASDNAPVLKLTGVVVMGSLKVLLALPRSYR